ncbi:hypothetical protein ACVIU7_007389 [Bradyrhizobium liaoningense]
MPSPAEAGEMVWVASCEIRSDRPPPHRSSIVRLQVRLSVSDGVASRLRGTAVFGARLPSKSPSPAPAGSQGRLVPLALTARTEKPSPLCVRASAP